MPLPRQSHGKPDGVRAPEIACVMADGGRYQLLDRSVNASQRSARKGDHWKESRIGLLASMSGEQHDCDPQPELPPELRYRAIAQTLTEIGKTGAKQDDPDVGSEPEDRNGDGVVGPSLVSRAVVASRQNWEAFGPLLASQAWQRGFAASSRKVFVSDGSSTIEKMQKRWFSHYTSVLDILHCFSYVLAAARAITATEAEAQTQYDDWAEKIWKGNAHIVIHELLAHQRKRGLPPKDAKSDDPREVIRVSRVYLENHESRMDYPSYRKQGFPLVSSLMESMVKQVSRRVKGTEKYWSTDGSEAIIRLCGEYLCDDDPIDQHWGNRETNADGTRAYRTAKSLAMNK